VVKVVGEVKVAARMWAIVAFVKGIKGAELILRKLNEELTEEQMEQSGLLLDKIFQQHPEMLGGRFIDLFPPVNELAENKLKKTSYQV
jgi:hypothetical protein